MKTTKALFVLLTLVVIFTIVGCKWIEANAPTPTATTPGVADNIRKSLDQAGLKDVTIANDSDRGIVTLGGQVISITLKAQAEAIAKSYSGSEVVANQIAIIPAGQGPEVKAVNSDLDHGIASNLDAVLIQNKMHDDVKYDVKNGVVTLSGNVQSDSERSSAELAANSIPNVLQVVNALQVVKDRKASSSN